MKRISLLTGIILIFACSLMNVYAAPDLVNYQGKLTDNNGYPLDGTYGIVFKIYDVVTGGTEIWTQTINPVTVTHGHFNVILSNGITNAFSGDTRYIGLTVPAISATEISPRQQILSTPFAIRADYASSAGVTADNSVTSEKIENGEVKAEDIGTGEVGASEIATNAVGASEIATNAVGASEIAANAVGSSEIANRSVTIGDLASDIIPLPYDGGGTGTAICSCVTASGWSTIASKYVYIPSGSSVITLRCFVEGIVPAGCTPQNNEWAFRFRVHDKVSSTYTLTNNHLFRAVTTTLNISDITQNTLRLIEIEVKASRCCCTMQGAICCPTKISHINFALQ